MVEIVECEEDGKKVLVVLQQNTVVVVPVIRFDGKMYTLLVEEFWFGAHEMLSGFPTVVLVSESLFACARRVLWERLLVDARFGVEFVEMDIGGRAYSSPQSTNEQMRFVRAEIALPWDVLVVEMDGAVVLRDGLHVLPVMVRELVDDVMFELPVLGHKLALHVVVAGL